MISYFFQPHILQPIRITDHSATLIDNIYFNSIDHSTTSGNIIYDISDHLPNFLIVSKLNFKIFKNDVFVRDYSHYNEEDLITETDAVNWETVYNSDGANLAFNTFFNKLNMIIEKHVPLKKLSKNKVKLLTKPWITKGLKISIKNKNKLYKSYLKSKNGHYLSKFKLVRNKLKHLLLISKNNYYNNYVLIKKDNIKETWKGIKQLITLKKVNYSFPTLIKVGNDAAAIASAFNEYFTNIGTKFAESIPVVNSSYKKFLRRPLCNSFMLFPADCSEIENEIEKLKLGKSTGPFSIPINLLKTIKMNVSEPLTYIYNWSFSSGTVPNKLKIAQVIPIYKKGSTFWFAIVK